MTKINIFLVLVIILLCGALWKAITTPKTCRINVLHGKYSWTIPIVKNDDKIITIDSNYSLYRHVLTTPSPPASPTPQVTGIELYPTSMPSNAGCGWVEWHSNTPDGCNQ